METQFVAVLAYALALGLVVYLLDYIAETVLTGTARRFVKLGAVVLAVLILIGLLVQLAGGGIVSFPV